MKGRAGIKTSKAKPAPYRATKPPTTDTQAAAVIIEGIAEEDDRLPRRPLQWMSLMIVAAIVGGAVGVMGAAFRIALIFAERGRIAIVNLARIHMPPWLGWILPAAVCATGAGIGLWLTQRLAPRTAGSGIPRVEAVLRNHLRPAATLILPVKFIGGALSIGSGLALGREGPTVQMGGTIGRLLGDAFGRLTPEPWTLIAAGAGAGLAVAFNAPLAATLFVVEELLHRFSARIFSAALIACITGTVVLRALLGNAPEFHAVQLGSAVHAEVLPAYLLLGLFAGLIGVGFNITLLQSLKLFDRAAHWPRGMKGALVGALAGVIAWYSPHVAGGGETLTQHAILQPLAIDAVLALLLIRFVLTMASYGCGAPGGIFAPLLAIGALVGNLFSAGLSAIGHAPPDPATFAVVAMAACFTAIVRSPLTGVVLLLEMTGSWTLILPMMAASVTAYAVPELLGNPPIYESLRERDEASELASRRKP